MRFILKYLKKYPLLLILDCITVCGFALIELGIPTIVAKMIDQGILSNSEQTIYMYGLLIVAISIIGVSGSIILGYVSSKITTNITRDMRRDIFKQAQNFTASEMNHFGVSSMITRTNNDAYQVQQFVNVLLRTALLTPIMFIASFFMTLKASVPLSMVILATAPFIVGGVIYVAKKSGPISLAQQEGLDGLNRISKENISGLRVVRSFNREEYEINRFKKQNEDYTKHSKSLFTLMMMTAPLFYLLMNIASNVIYILAAYFIQDGILQVGQLVAFMDYLFHAMFSMMLFCNVFLLYPRAKVSVDRMKEVLDYPIAIKDNKNNCDNKQETSISFEHVGFAYPGSEEYVINDVSFEAKKGEVVAFIGSTGSGKSTLLKLIPRLYDVSRGSIKINGIDVRDYPFKQLRDMIGFVAQKAFLFSNTIEENLRYGKKDASDEEIKKACELALAYDFIMEKEHGFQEMVSEGATNLSGGQKQRLSIARALLKQAPIYLFDDSFSALDYKTDAMIRSNLAKEMKNAIMLIVAQRISTIMHADQIIVLHEGCVVGKGTHQELLKNCDIYRELAYSQLSEEELNYEG